ncbi:MAG: hypothetical protein LUQ50_03545 [Methanospirillum sp.]|uniref:Rpp14/Pop5 family protein n=1 Tax=Methanospirillum sp. TaxID=45200 RepID=UPI002370185E|nr:Rpp14/Pop5 family protein [Methanospirillum sp.]MDD1728127.1 hypothetical protein [Methanospirillum sp.]
MRENYRYLLARIEPPVPMDAKEIFLVISDVYCSLFGEIQASYAWIAVMEYTPPYGIFRCRRGYEHTVEAALSCVTSIRGIPSVIHPFKTSGTIRTIREKINQNKVDIIRTGKVKVNETWISVEINSTDRIDLKEKGINHNMPLYITEEDIEDLYYDE